VTDPSGALVPGASVVARNTNTGFEFTSNSNEAGIYVTPFVPPGPYELRVGKRGSPRFCAKT